MSEKNNGWFQKYLEKQFEQVERLTNCVDEHEKRMDAIEKEMAKLAVKVSIICGGIVLGISILSRLVKF